mgnify:CR=1 FL=1
MRNRVKELRKERNIHQKDLAAKLNVSQQTISRIENETTSLHADILIDLSKFFNVSIDYLLFRSDVRYRQEHCLEYHQLSEQNYQLCRIYELMDKRNQILIFQLMEQLSKTPEKEPEIG